MRTSSLLIASIALVTGCGFAARSPEMYRDETKSVLEKKNGEIHACYDAVLKGTPGAGGKVTVKFDVETEEGKITNVAVDKANTTAPDAVSDCVAKSIGGLSIKPPDARKGEASFTYEFKAPTGPAPAAPPKS